ncbi:MAG: hypothetical protein LBC61_02505 [Candidatus Peribacteria bacterium]|nr:hypothetical protein [Candidatus Peribacteria bacterium]
MKSSILSQTKEIFVTSSYIQISKLFFKSSNFSFNSGVKCFDFREKLKEVSVVPKTSTPTLSLYNISKAL